MAESQKGAGGQGERVETVLISTISKDPANVRRHNRKNLDAIKASLRAFGQQKPIVVSKAGIVLAGNGTMEAALELGWEKIQVIHSDLEGTAATAYAIADNRTAELAEWDHEGLAQQLAAIQIDDDALAAAAGYSQSEIDKLALMNVDDVEFETELAEVKITEYKESVIFPSSNPYDIPDLRADMLYDGPITDVVLGPSDCETTHSRMFIWSTFKFNADRCRGGVLAFYVDDHRFSNIMSHATKFIDDMKKCEWAAILSPDFSMWRNEPLVIQLYAAYCSRWCARYWQEAGFKIVPSLNWSDERTHDMIHAGIPKGAPVVSVQCRTLGDKKAQSLFLEGVQKGVETIDPGNVVVYGGLDHSDWLKSNLPESITSRMVLIESWTAKRNRIRKIT
jgi:hypothetical protein